MSFTNISKILQGKTGKVSIRGWIQSKRSSGGIIFLQIRDGTGTIQTAVKKDSVDEKIFRKIEKLNLESAIEISGEAKKDQRAPSGYEISAGKIKILQAAASDFPVERKHEFNPDYELDNRHFFLRTKKMQLVTKVRAKILQLAREWFEKNGFTEVHVPSIVGAAVEGGATLFQLDYFGKPAYLTQSWQLYGEAYIYSVGKCYTIAPSFRAEKSRTRRHLAEYWHLEAEMPFCDMECLMKTEEEFLEYICHKLAKEMPDELKEMGRDPKDLLKIKTPFPKITYDEAVKALQESGVKVNYGDDFGADEEKVLTEKFDVPFFVTHFPKQTKAFYHKLDPKNQKLTLSVDMLAPEGVGEIIGSGQRIHDYDELMKRIKEEKLNPKDYQWYADLRKFGSVEHSGFGLGIERLVMWICKLEHVRDAIAFPRMMNRLTP